MRRRDGTTIAVIGAGAVGCYLAERLGRCGYRVVLIGRGARLEALARGGLLVRDGRGAPRRVVLEVAERLTVRPDVVLLAVHVQDVAQACRELLPLAAGVPVVALENGLVADEMAAAALGAHCVLGGVVMSAVTALIPGEITVHISGWLIIGEPFRGPGRRLRWIARLLDRAVPTLTTADLRAVRWMKLVFNLNNALCAASGLTLPEVGANPTGRLLSLRLMREAQLVARAAGIRLGSAGAAFTPRGLLRHPRVLALVALQQWTQGLPLLLPERAGAVWLAALARGPLGRIALRGSTWQSIMRGRPSEMEYLNGEIVRQGALHAIPTPYNAYVVNLVREVERTHTFQPLALPVPERQWAGAPVEGKAR